MNPRPVMRLAQLILAGVPELYAADVGVTRTAWHYLVGAAGLEEFEPFGFPTYWMPTDASVAWAQRKMRGRPDSERAAVARKRHCRNTIAGIDPARLRIAG